MSFKYAVVFDIDGVLYRHSPGLGCVSVPGAAAVLSAVKGTGSNVFSLDL